MDRWSLALVLSMAVAVVHSDDCIRAPIEQTESEVSEGTNGFHLEIRQYPRNDSVPPPSGYVPGEFYTLVLRGYRTAYTVQTFRGFSIVALGKDTKTGAYDRPVGKFRLSMGGPESGVERSEQCWHGVSQTSLHPKAEAVVVWQAPPEDAGCVQFKAMVLEYRDIWYMDSGNLTRSFCQLIGISTMVPDDSARECCACDEAKYELEFQGLWSRNTHPKDFPDLVHLTHFSDIIGASHSAKFHLWSMGTYATDGLRELAEWGNTYSLEQELKTKAKEIRTIVKARGLWYPNVLGTAKAMFRVDKYHHFASLASMFGPSPDWCVGVDAANLCLPDCSWVAERSFDLFPWDAGTDSGPTYMSPNNPTLPRNPIKPITTKDPSDPKAPFYDPYKSHMPPLARLTLRREKVYPMECKNDSEYQRKAAEELSTSEQLEFADRRECMVESWTPWSLCSATCGKGIRMRSRVYRIPIKAQMFNCQRQMTEKQFCNAPISVCAEGSSFAAENGDCRTSLWSEWTACSVTCGMGTRSRTKNYEALAAAVAGGCSEDLVDEEECEGAGGLDCSVEPDPRCRLTFWSDFSPCSASCGPGLRVRTRMFYFPENAEICGESPGGRRLMEREECNDGPCQSFFTERGREICAEPVEKGQCNGVFPRYYYSALELRCLRFTFTGCKGNRNNFETLDQCRKACDDRYQDTNIVPANQLAEALGVSEVNDGGAPLDCRVSYWSPWSECSRSCGRGRRQRTRSIEVFQRNNGRACPPNLVQRMRCVMKPCPAETRCVLSGWSEWSTCSASCGRGRQIRRRRPMGGPRRRGLCGGRQRLQRRACEGRYCADVFH